MSKQDRALGCFMGLAVGDAFGVPLEFKDRDTLPKVIDMIGGGVFRLNPGEWTDDTSMALALADSVLIRKTVDKEDVMQRFVRWYQTGAYSHNGKCFDIGRTTVRALLAYIVSKQYKDCLDDHMASGNGSIMRLAPVPIYWHDDIDKAVEMAKRQSVTTHASQQVLACVEELTIILVSLINGLEKDEVISQSLRTVPRSAISSSGYVLDTLNAAKWAVANTDSFEDALILAVNLGDDADTVGAVTGQIAGALYGFTAIRTDWVNKLVWRDNLLSYATQLYTRS